MRNMTYSIKNWNDFQHYKTRNPPWIKLHKKLLDDPEFHALSGDASKTLAMCWLIASEDNGKLPAINKLAFRLRIDSKLLAKHLIELKHWITNDASVMLAECLQDACPETETETETKREREEKNIQKKNFEDLFEIFPSQRKGNREKAEAAYRQALKRDTHENIMFGLKSYLDSDEVKRGFAKGAAAWLNDDRWKTDYTAKINGGTDGRPKTQIERAFEATERARIAREQRSANTA